MTQAGPSTTVKEEQEVISPKNVQAFSVASVRSARFYGKLSLNKTWSLQADSSVLKLVWQLKYRFGWGKLI